MVFWIGAKMRTYNVTAKAGAGGRYIYDHVQIMGIDMSQFGKL